MIDFLKKKYILIIRKNIRSTKNENRIKQIKIHNEKIRENIKNAISLKNTFSFLHKIPKLNRLG